MRTQKLRLDHAYKSRAVIPGPDGAERIVTPFHSTGNTDCKMYYNLTKNVYRFMGSTIDRSSNAVSIFFSSCPRQMLITHCSTRSTRKPPSKAISRSSAGFMPLFKMQMSMKARDSNLFKANACSSAIRCAISAL